MKPSPPSFEDVVEEICREDPRYRPGAYEFVHEALDYTVRTLKKARSGPNRHVTGRELLDGARRYALERYGPMARLVLNHWGIHRCEDIGNVVFNMVDRKILGKSEEDSIEDFRDGFDFDEAFDDPFLPRSRKKKTARNRRSGS